MLQGLRSPHTQVLCNTTSIMFWVAYGTFFWFESDLVFARVRAYSMYGREREKKNNLFVCHYRQSRDWCCFYYFLRNSLVALLEALFARKNQRALIGLQQFLPLMASIICPKPGEQVTNMYINTRMYRSIDMYTDPYVCIWYIYIGLQHLLPLMASIIYPRPGKQISLYTKIKCIFINMGVHIWTYIHIYMYSYVYTYVCIT